MSSNENTTEYILEVMVDFDDMCNPYKRYLKEKEIQKNGDKKRPN